MSPATPPVGRARPASMPPLGRAPNPVTTPAFTVIHRRGRQWVDADEVDAYVAQVREAFVDVDQRFITLNEELHRVKTALAQWQRRHGPAATDDGYHGDSPPPRPLRGTEITADHPLPHRDPHQPHPWGGEPGR